jgi:hypothetical protein
LGKEKGQVTFSARCPKCGNCSFEPPASLDVALEVCCQACGHRGKLVEFADLATLDEIVDELKKQWRRTFKSCNGTRALG